MGQRFGRLQGIGLQEICYEKEEAISTSEIKDKVGESFTVRREEVPRKSCNFSCIGAF